ncbi:hypothetical protein H5410_063619 [Solanum commersonii]|uniref:DUF8040 domain-containing protein n=1 Tax=Solanum commersonii TaxID=4109 RepID=A0A9J5WEE1_SOLCO|nr:hypothetical protein H5410_063619 [Solanum commersonii]
MDLQHLSTTEYIILEEIMSQQFLVVLIWLFMAIHGHSLRRRYRHGHEIRYRMSAQIPKNISHLNCIINDSDSDIGGLTDGKYMSSSEKLAMFLNILTHHEKNKSIKVDYIRFGWSVSQAFNECLRAILKLTPLLLVNPKPVHEDEIEDRWKCALDVTYVHIKVPSEYKPRYKTRKGDIATNVLGVCDRNFNFTYVLPGWEGSAVDGSVLRDAIVRRNGLKIPEVKMSNQTSSHTSKRSRNSTPLTRRTWTAAEERTLIDGLKELCINGWRSDNGTFRSGYLKELECYLRKHHPNSGLKGEPHVLSKTRYWKKCYASIAMLKSVDWDFNIVDPNAKNMDTKKWPMFANWEEIFGRDRAT